MLLTIVLGLSAAVLIPLVVAACTSTATLAIVYLLAHEFLMVLYIPNVVELIGLGLAVDYSLLIVHRFREELAVAERPVEDAIARTMATAGRAVLLSGIAVAIGLSALLIIPVPFLRSLGVAGFLVPVVSIVAALTLQPTLLSLLGRRGMSSVRLLWVGEKRDIEHGLWSRLAALCHAAAPRSDRRHDRGVSRQWCRWRGSKLTPASDTAIPQSIDSARALRLLSDHVGPGVIGPIEVVLDARAPGRALSPAISRATLRLAHQPPRQPRGLRRRDRQPATVRRLVPPVPPHGRPRAG